MLRSFTKKRVIGALAAIAALALAAGAFAYFSGSGSGSGSATVGTTGGFTIGETGTTGATTLYPDASVGVAGGYVQTHSFSVTNAGKGSQKVSSFIVKVAKSDGTAWSAQSDTSKPACTASDFSVGGEAVGATHEITTLEGEYTGGQVKNGSVTVEMIDNGNNQDNCQTVTVPLYYSAS